MFALRSYSHAIRTEILSGREVRFQLHVLGAQVGCQRENDRQDPMGRRRWWTWINRRTIRQLQRTYS